MYLEQRKYQKSLGVTDLLTEILECYRIQVFENNRLFSLVGQPHPYAKTRYYSLQHGYHIDCYNAAGVLGIRDKAVESCRKCAELEQLIQDLPSKVIIPFLEPVFGPLTISRLRNEITDDQLWNRISEAMAMFSLASLVNLGTKMCPICLSMENLTAAVVGLQRIVFTHRYDHWEQHKEYCKCAYCGSSTKNLKLCAKCRQKAFCCKDHQRKHWPEHKEEWKEWQKSYLALWNSEGDAGWNISFSGMIM
eukprot:CAMPEP_0183727428 /NCGR_PEP_ID=MMETSP0737-20130205/25696_1 /TAXON_ID=385413 /ORGANISM="Thalassiosira miniscula, Strain CCMP1093" /LENGTH=248 /DNA_ID=CAMNT_0025959073 /DNA_START=1048 /DNA_END=1795 /DNA_ORIENTATION=-